MKFVRTLLMILVTTACVASTSVNEIGLEYTGGITEDKALRSLIPPGATAQRIGFGNTIYLYPTDQRTYRFSTDAGGDVTQPIIAPSREGTRIVLEGFITFKLCIPVEEKTLTDDWGTFEAYASCLQSFHENVGLKTHAYEQEGWIAMLSEFLRPAINSSVNRATRQFTIDELLTVEALDALNAQIARELPRELSDVMFGPHFYISSVSFEQVVPESIEVQSEYDERAAARLDVATERERGQLRAIQQQNLAQLASTFESEDQLICFLQIELGRELNTMPPPCFSADEPQQVVDVGG